MKDLNVLTGNLHPQIYKLKSAFSRCSFDSNSNRVNCQFIKHNAQRKTELNWTGSFSWVEFSSVFHCALNRQRAVTTGNGTWQSRTIYGHLQTRRQSSQLVAGFRPTTDIALIGRLTSVSWLWRTCDERRFCRRIVAGRRRFSAQRETELNWTVESLNSWVEFSSVSRYALGFKLLVVTLCRVADLCCSKCVSSSKTKLTFISFETVYMPMSASRFSTNGRIFFPLY